MTCESCKINKAETSVVYDEQFAPYYLCFPCQVRLEKKALRPLEYFNLAAIHGNEYYLHDDFYEDSTGQATQPKIEIIDADKFPFPSFKEVKTDLSRLIDFAFVQYDTTDEVNAAFHQFKPQDILSIIDSKISYNKAIRYKAYRIVAHAVGRAGESWLRNEWSGRKENELLLFAEALAKCLPTGEAFGIITSELEHADDLHLAEKSTSLIYFQSAKTLAWMESIADRIHNVSPTWGLLAAASQFDWKRAEGWLNRGRPLSLIALDALVHCTTKQDETQSLWLKKNPIQLLREDKKEIISAMLEKYLASDNVPRTRHLINKVLSNFTKLQKS